MSLPNLQFPPPSSFTLGRILEETYTQFDVPAGIGTEIQYRLDPKNVGAIAGTSWDGSTLTLPSLIVFGTKLQITAGSLIPITDHTVDLGDSTHRIKLIYVSQAIISASFNTPSVYQLDARWQLKGGGADGKMALAGWIGDFSMLAFTNSAGDMDATHPAFKRNVATMETRFADDSGFAAHQSLYCRFGAGTPEGVVTAPIGTSFSRTDGGAGTSFYVKESGAGNTGWIAK